MQTHIATNKYLHKYYKSCFATLDRLLKLSVFGLDEEDNMMKASDKYWDDIISVILNTNKYILHMNSMA
jgi:hypothetical protein